MLPISHWLQAYTPSRILNIMNHPTTDDWFLEKESLEVQSLDRINNPENSESGANENYVPALEIAPKTQLVTVDESSPTICVLWDRVVQTAVINISPAPTVASRTYAILHTGIFDAWTTYHPKAISTQLGDDLQDSSPEITEAKKTEVMSEAAYRVWF